MQTTNLSNRSSDEDTDNESTSWTIKITSPVIAQQLQSTEKSISHVTEKSTDSMPRLVDYTKCRGGSFDLTGRSTPSTPISINKQPFQTQPSSQTITPRQSLARSITYERLQAALNSAGSTPESMSINSDKIDHVEFLLKIPNAKVRRHRNSIGSEETGRTPVQELRDCFNRRQPSSLRRSPLAMPSELEQQQQQQHQSPPLIPSSEELKVRRLVEETTSRHFENHYFSPRRKRKTNIIRREIKSIVATDERETLSADDLSIMNSSGNMKRARSLDELFAMLHLESAPQANIVNSKSSSNRTMESKGTDTDAGNPRSKDVSPAA